MKTASMTWNETEHWIGEGADANLDADLVLYFAAPAALAKAKPWQELARRFPRAHVVGCTTGGEISADEVLDDSVVAVAISFDAARVAVAQRQVGENSESAGLWLAGALEHDGLKGVLVFSDGTLVNGSALVRGLRAGLPETVPITGGLAGDGAAFQQTRVGVDGEPTPGTIVALGLYGEGLDIRHGSFGGWEPFGPQRLVTRSWSNILYELDGQPALDLYRRYLGEEADQLPGSALLYPLRIRETASSETDVVRTVVGIDEGSRAMVFAGDVPKGYVAQLMRGNFDHLIAGAGTAAEQTGVSGGQGLAILISCIGRKLLLGPRINQEVEAVIDALGGGVDTIGFYSYGEISPHGFTKTCELHNQTMTITVIREV